MRNTDSLPTGGKLDSDLLRTFLAVAHSGSLSAAAQTIFRSQSAVSLQVKRLEAIVGQAIFERHGRGVELTAAGEKLFPAAEQVISLLDRTAGELRRDPLEGSFSIGIPEEYGESLLADVIARFARRHPRLELSVRCAFSALFPEAVERGELDLAIHETEVPESGMVELRRERTLWVTSNSHDAHKRDPLPLALFDRACWWRERCLEALRRSGRDYRVVFTSESETGIAAAVSAGIAIGVAAEHSLRPGFSVLGVEQGFPELPDSVLVMQTRADLEPGLASSLGNTLTEAFGKRPLANT